MNTSPHLLIGQQIQSSPNAFHATAQLVQLFEQRGFKRLSEADTWNALTPGGYYVIRNESSLIAFTLTGESIAERGFAMVGAHTDSPCLKLKPKPDVFKQGYFQLSVEVYGGALLNPWFDRDLSLAGRVSFLTTKETVKTALIDFKRPIAIIPSLAIHLDRDANKKRSINAQTDILPILGLASAQTFKEICLQQMQKENIQDISALLDFELFFYDTQEPRLIGLDEAFLASARLDNLVSCFLATQSLLDAPVKRPMLLVCNDHEEVGSASTCGANGPFLHTVLERLANTQSELHQCIHRSLFLSVDNAHGIHPNFPDKHDEHHGPLLNSGPVIKMNANQRYATNAQTSAYIQMIARQHAVPLQSFVVRSDMACGSTIGPITASEIGVKTLDIGIPTFAMHSIRELAGCLDMDYLYQLIKGFYQHEGAFI